MTSPDQVARAEHGNIEGCAHTEAGLYVLRCWMKGEAVDPAKTFVCKALIAATGKPACAAQYGLIESAGRSTPNNIEYNPSAARDADGQPYEALCESADFLAHAAAEDDEDAAERKAIALSRRQRMAERSEREEQDPGAYPY